MADHFYGVNLGAGAEPGGAGGAASVTVGTSTGSQHVELRITDAVSGITNNKRNLLNALEAIKSKLIETDTF